MLENLLQSLPPHRHAELHRQLELLDRTIDARFAFEEDRALARIADSQGLGGALGLRPSDSAFRAGRETPGRRDEAAEALEPSAGASLGFVAVAVAAERVIAHAAGAPAHPLSASASSRHEKRQGPGGRTPVSHREGHSRIWSFFIAVLY